MKELLMKRKSRFMMYILACFIPVLDNTLMNLAISMVIGSIQIGTKENFLKVLWVSMGIIILGSILYIVSRFMRISYMRDTLLDVRLLAFDKILNSSYKEFSKKSKDTYISNLINDINLFESSFFLQLINVIFRGGVYVVSLTIIAFLDLKFAVGAFGISILLFFISKTFEKKTVSLQKEVSEYNEHFTVNMSNTFNGLEILKLNNIENQFLSKSLKSIMGLERKKFAYNVYTDSQRRIMEFLGFGFVMISLVYLSALMSKGISLTKITYMFQLSNGCIWNITSILPLFNQLKSSAKIFDKITKWDDEKFIAMDKEKEFIFENQIKVKDLYFQYDGKEILKDTSFTIEKGKKYLLKGASGAGKSTLIKLLSMTYDDYEGEITVDSISYKDIKESSLNNKVSFIYQDVFLFEDTIYNNIALYKPYDEERILRAANEAGLDGLLRKKENGINEMLMENGKNLSGGERQRISIARAIVKDSEILFVDEGTSSLDEELGRKVEDTILSLDCTVIAISHRYYEGITEKYDYVLEIKNQSIEKYNSKEYFMEVAI
ncbi:ABC transporter ATP-binding protein [Tissierella sp. MB52-C2]|uniref:ABC transporter ATP-binding protein n=1 Tax=Tissierella sp. MB52-C2 TaxID=3070999 RepID=UPI00280A79EA|nr:ABC transporter ATP-binding protein [Tissierella sp. MB52-C2]WMM23756.1 ABC transporter ATP-binding protein [Tissierella sp. MB52-C2]